MREYNKKEVIDIEEEQEILTDEKAVLDLRMKTDMARYLRTAAAFLVLGYVRGAIVDNYEKQKLQKRISSIKEASEGDIGMLIGAQGVRGKLILTKNHLILLFQVGFRKKVDKFVAIPLKFARSVEKASWFGVQRFLLMKFEVPSDEKLIGFDLRIFVKKQEQWLTELTRALG